MTTATDAQVDYTLRSMSLEDEARALPRSAPLSARYVRHMAQIAYRAAKAELDDPEPPERMCSVCHGSRRCDLDAHRNRP